MRDRQFSQGSPRRLRIPRPDRKIQAPSAIVPTRCVVNVARSIICPGRARAIERQQEALAETEAISAMASRSEEHTSELQSLMRISYAVFCLTKKKQIKSH